MEPIDLLAISAVMMAGAILQGSVGLGLGLVAAPFLLMIDPALIPGPLMANAFVLVLAMTIRERRAVDITSVSWAVAGAALGSGAAVILLKLIPFEAFTLLFGLVLLAGVGLSAMKWTGLPSRGLIFAAGAVSGLMGTTTSIGGPPLALVFQNSKGEHLRATMSVYFVAASLLALGGLAIAGRFGVAEMKLAAYLLPGMLAGLYVSNYTRHHFRPEYVRRVVLILSTIAAAVILLRYFS
ncbi:MAG: TSUP family transporter [Rhodothermia bacterium]